MVDKKKFIYFLGYYPNFHHGGVRRTNQILNELSRTYTPIAIDTKNLRQEIKCIGNWVKYVLQMVKVFFITKGTLSAKLKSSALSGVVNSFIERTNPDFIVYDFVDSPYKYLWMTFKNSKMPVIAVIHNIEFLVCSSDTVASEMINFYNQIEAIKYADLSITISTIDDYICRVYGANTLLLPYMPTTEEIYIYRKIAKDRAASKNAVRNKILILGTAHNKPTRLGILNLLANIDRWKADSDELLLAGFGTKDYFNSSEQVEVLGAVSQTELYSILREVKCCVIFQPPASGKLTKLVELKLCKVPVFINSAYISAEESGFLKKYSDYDQLRTLIAAVDEVFHICKSECEIHLNGNIGSVIHELLLSNNKIKH